MDVVGYMDRLGYRPGDTARLMASAAAGEYAIHLVRFGRSDDHSVDRPWKHERVDADLPSTLRLSPQQIRAGSYVRSAEPLLLAGPAGVSVHIRALFTKLDSSGGQTLAAQVDHHDGHLSGWDLSVERARLSLTVWTSTGPASVSAPCVLAANCWYSVMGVIDDDAGAVTVSCRPIEPRWSTTPIATASMSLRRGSFAATRSRVLTVGARLAADGFHEQCFNGKLEGPTIYSAPLSDDDILRAHDGVATDEGAVLAWDFARDITTTVVTCALDREHAGQTVNLPLRGVTGSRWRRAETDWRTDPSQWAAIHFHDDDLGDATWATSLTWTVPAELASGAYAFEITDGSGTDYVPFAVMPTDPTSDVLWLMPTMSYLAYANDHLVGGGSVESLLESIGPVHYPWQPQDRYVVEHGLHSLYDTHTDGSGVAISALRRPLVTMRPGYLHPRLGSPRQFAADLQLLEWLAARDVNVDVVTDHELDRVGVSALQPYRVLVTGTHPEYWTQRMLDALEQFQSDGGRVMYLGGNGLYWVTATDPEGSGAIEIRRRTGIRTWEAAAGEDHLAFSGELGGLWRDRGRAPQRSVGVGMAAWGRGPGRPYVVTPQASSERVSFVLDGITSAEIGASRSKVNEWGAAGFEFDRADLSAGTPPHAIVIASATGFSARYWHTVEEILVADGRHDGENEPRVRSDLVFFETGHGGATFSTGSIQWVGCLDADDSDDTVGQVTWNVLRRFRNPEPFAEPSEVSDDPNNVSAQHASPSDHDQQE